MSVKVAIQYGIIGGPLRGRTFVKQLRASGFELVSNDQADVIIAHSAGCFDLPTAPSTTKLLLVNPPYWPGKSVRQRLRQRLRSNNQFRAFGYTFRHWLWRNGVGFYYATTRLRHNIGVYKQASVYDFEAAIAGHSVTVIRNHHDEWLTPELNELRERHGQIRLVELPGDHDDIWCNPKPYIALLQEITKS